VLANWENNGSGNIKFLPRIQARIEAASNRKFAHDFAAWAKAGSADKAANRVIADCKAAAGMPDVLNGGQSIQAPAPKRHHTHPKVPGPPPQTVTYVVTGSPADVTYGPAGTDLAGTVPMDQTAPLGNPLYYAISAQLQGGGAVSCVLKIDGRVISAATATGSYNIASCEVQQDPLSGQWINSNGG
jgi:hypothetical protein